MLCFDLQTVHFRKRGFLSQAACLNEVTIIAIYPGVISKNLLGAMLKWMWPIYKHAHIFKDLDMTLLSNLWYDIANIWEDRNSHIAVRKFTITIQYKTLEAWLMLFEKQNQCKRFGVSAPWVKNKLFRPLSPLEITPNILWYTGNSSDFLGDFLPSKISL